MRTLLAMCLVAAVAAGAGAAAKAEKVEKTEDAKLAKISYQVTGMSCASCEAKLSEKFTSLAGVNVDKVCSKSGHAAVSYDPAIIKPEAIAAAILVSGATTVADLHQHAVAGLR